MSTTESEVLAALFLKSAARHAFSSESNGIITIDILKVVLEHLGRDLGLGKEQTRNAINEGIQLTERNNAQKIAISQIDIADRLHADDKSSRCNDAVFEIGVMVGKKLLNRLSAIQSIKKVLRSNGIAYKAILNILQTSFKQGIAEGQRRNQ